MSSETCSYSLCLSHCSSCISMHYINTYNLHLYTSIYTSPRNPMITAEYNLSIRGTLNKGHLSNEDSVFVCIIMDPQNNTSECLYAAVCEEHCCSHSHGRWRKWCHNFAADWCTWLNFTVRDTTYMTAQLYNPWMLKGQAGPIDQDSTYIKEWSTGRRGLSLYCYLSFR